MSVRTAEEAISVVLAECRSGSRKPHSCTCRLIENRWICYFALNANGQMQWNRWVIDAATGEVLNREEYTENSCYWAGKPS